MDNKMIFANKKAEEIYNKIQEGTRIREELEHKKGKWKSDKKITPMYDSLFEIEDGYFCSECGKFARTISNYCPYCGADMRGEEDE